VGEVGWYVGEVGWYVGEVGWYVGEVGWYETVGKRGKYRSPVGLVGGV